MGVGGQTVHMDCLRGVPRGDVDGVAVIAGAGDDPAFRLVAGTADYQIGTYRREAGSGKTGEICHLSGFRLHRLAAKQKLSVSGFHGESISGAGIQTGKGRAAGADGFPGNFTCSGGTDNLHRGAVFAVRLHLNGGG